MQMDISIKFTDAAARLLPKQETGHHFPSLAALPIHPHVGDKLRIPDWPNCPWLAVVERYWEIGEKTVLTVWLDAPED